jgi:N-acetylmuramic acid 6-phosphate etherase
MVQGLIAGGQAAMFRAQEGAEDHPENGARDVDAHGISSRDFLVGIAASGTTPYVRGALTRAKELGARTAIVACSPPPADTLAQADIPIVAVTGPEVVTGSTRMKAGTATKLILNRMTLLAMIRLKKVYGPYMVALRPGSAKLRDRARRMIEALGGVDAGRAEELLEEAGDVKTAVVMARFGISSREARRRLDRKAGDLRAALSSAGDRARSRPRPAPARPRAPRRKPRARLS